MQVGYITNGKSMHLFSKDYAFLQVIWVTYTYTISGTELNSNRIDFGMIKENHFKITPLRIYFWVALEVNFGKVESDNNERILILNHF